MRSFRSLATRQILARRGRSALTAAGIVLGVAMILGVLLLSATLSRTFTDLFDSVYGETDLIVAGSGDDSVDVSILPRVRRTPGVERATGRLLAPFSLVTDDASQARGTGSARVNVAGERAGTDDLTDARTVEGRRFRGGREITLQKSWADSNGVELGDRIRLATPSGAARFRVVGLFEFAGGLDFGGEGFGLMPIARARELMDKRGVFDEVDVIVAGDGPGEIRRIQRRLERRLPGGVSVDTPAGRGEDVQEQLQAFNTVLYFFAAMALFVGGFLIFNSFNMTVLQRTREIGMVRTLGATRSMVVRSVLFEAAVLGLLGGAVGVGVGVLLALGLIEMMRSLDVPIGGFAFAAWALPVAVGTGLVTAVVGALTPARRAGRTSPIRAVLGGEGIRSRPRRRRALAGLVLIGLGGVGAFSLGAADETTTPVIAAGMGGVIAIFLGIAMVAPFVVAPLSRLLSRPLRAAFPVEGRLASEAASADPSRTAATATGLMIGLALVVAVNGLGSSFLSSIEEEIDESLARDLTVQPEGFSPGQGPQQRIAKDLERRLERIPEVGVAAAQRIVYTPELPSSEGKTDSDGLLVGFEPSEFRRVDSTPTIGATREELFDRMAAGQASVGEAWADEQDLETGDRIVLEGSSGTRRTRVGGIVQSTLFSGQLVGMSLRTMREVYGVTNDSQLALEARSEEERAAMERKVRRLVEREHPNLVVLSNEELKEDIGRQFDETFGFFNAIVGVAIFASLFGIINTLTMSVLQRTREIGVLRALGATRRQVRRQVAYEALVIGAIGALLGIAVGAGLGWALLKGLGAGIPGVSYEPPVTTMIVVGIAGVVLGRIAAVLPARRASRLNVVEALSYE